MESPPTLPELARTAGISETKLKRGFRMEYGSSVFEYLRKQRLDKARMLVEYGEMSVTQVALSIGFSSLSHFTCLFKSHCGVRPKDYSKGFRQRL